MELHGLDTEQQVFFYEQDYYVLSNFSSFQIEFEDLTFPTSEHAYHYQRFKRNDLASSVEYLTSGILELQLKIVTARSAHNAFKLAQEHRHLQRPDWDDVKVGIMERILLAKAQQHEYVMRKLIATGDRELVENSWRDDFWGIGPEGNGRNELGKCWMRVRDMVRIRGEIEE